MQERLIVDPERFRVPYAFGSSGTIYQIRDGRPQESEVMCPLCKTAVSFVRETDERAAHFRHHSASECDVLARYHRETLHDAVRDAAAALLRSGVGARRICRGFAPLPTGHVATEETQDVDDRTYRPDLVVHPKEDEAAPILELEVVYSHRPEPKRLERAAADGRVVGVMDIAPIERDYYRKLWAGEAFDIPEACKVFVMDTRFTVMDNAAIRRQVRGVLEQRRTYLLAKVRGVRGGVEIASREAEDRKAADLVITANKAANDVLERLRAVPPGEQRERLANTMSDVIRSIETRAPVRAIHIENLVRERP